MSAAFNKARPQTTKVLIRTDPDAASVNDDSADAQRRKGKQASRQIRSKHTLEEPLLQAPKQKRSRSVIVPFFWRFEGLLDMMQYLSVQVSVVLEPLLLLLNSKDVPLDGNMRCGMTAMSLSVSTSNLSFAKQLDEYL